MRLRKISGWILVFAPVVLTTVGLRCLPTEVSVRLMQILAVFAAFEEAVYDEKKKNMDVRLDDGEMNVDSLDSTEYSTESIQDEIMYIAA